MKLAIGRVAALAAAALATGCAGWQAQGFERHPLHNLEKTC